MASAARGESLVASWSTAAAFSPGVGEKREGTDAEQDEGGDYAAFRLRRHQPTVMPMAPSRDQTLKVDGSGMTVLFGTGT